MKREIVYSCKSNPTLQPIMCKNGRVQRMERKTEQQ